MRPLLLLLLRRNVVAIALVASSVAPTPAIATATTAAATACCCGLRLLRICAQHQKNFSVVRPRSKQGDNGFAARESSNGRAAWRRAGCQQCGVRARTTGAKEAAEEPSHGR